MLASSNPYMFDTLVTGMDRPAVLTFPAFSAILLAAVRPIKSMLMFTSAQTYRTNRLNSEKFPRTCIRTHLKNILHSRHSPPCSTLAILPYPAYIYKPHLYTLLPETHNPLDSSLATSGRCGPPCRRNCPSSIFRLYRSSSHSSSATFLFHGCRCICRCCILLLLIYNPPGNNWANADQSHCHRSTCPHHLLPCRRLLRLGNRGSSSWARHRGHIYRHICPLCTLHHAHNLSYTEQGGWLVF